MHRSEAVLVSVFGYYPSYTDWVFIPVLMRHTVAVRSLTLMACGFIKGVSVCFVPKIRLNSNTPIKHNTCWLQTLLRVQTALLQAANTCTTKQLLSHKTALISLYS